MRWPRLPDNLLTRSVIFEALVTVDRTGETVCSSSTLDRDAPVKTIVAGIIASGTQLIAQGEKLAKDHGLKVKVSRDGTMVVG